VLALAAGNAKQMSAAESIAVLIPCYNEEGSLRLLYESLSNVTAKLKDAFTFVLSTTEATMGARRYWTACPRPIQGFERFILLEILEKTRLLAREHPGGYCCRQTEQIKNSYIVRSSLCAALLKFGIR